MHARELLERYRAGERQFGHANLWGENLQHASLPDADFERAHLTNADLSGANLIGVNLWGADLERANLAGANLERANLEQANLKGANLRDADLVGANLVNANLEDTDLQGADLERANLTDALLADADLTDASCRGTVFGNVDLRSAKGLDCVRHRYQSTVGIDTLYASGGQIPDAFLRGCGVPEHIIDLQKSLVGAASPIQFYSCFISYSSADEEFARRLHGRLQQEGLRIWYAPQEMKGGRKLAAQIDEAIRLHDKLLLVLSETSMKSNWVETEMLKARKREKDGKQVLFPITLVPYDPPVKNWELFDSDTGEDLARRVREYFIPDFSDWKDHDGFETAFARLLRDLRASAE